MTFDDETLAAQAALQVPIEVRAMGSEVVRVIVHGDVDLSEAGELRAVLNDACTGPHRTVQLDLADVHFIGSSGIGVVLEVHQRMVDDGRSLEVLHASDAIRAAFEIAGVAFVL